MTRKRVKVRVIHSENGDWAGLYIDGKLRREGHDILTRDLVAELTLSGVILPFDFSENYASGEVAGRINETGRMPERWESL